MSTSYQTWSIAANDSSFFVSSDGSSVVLSNLGIFGILALCQMSETHSMDVCNWHLIIELQESVSVMHLSLGQRGRGKFFKIDYDNRVGAGADILCILQVCRDLIPCVPLSCMPPSSRSLRVQSQPLQFMKLS